METGKIEIDVGGTLSNILFKLEILERDVEQLKKEMTELQPPTKESDICGECGEHRPDDDRVKAGMKCRFCAYGEE